jgi:flagellar assembly protein FliH
MNMLSKVVEAKEAQKLAYQSYRLPSPEDVDLIIEAKKQEDRRMKIIEKHQDDPLKAAKKEANRIMVEAQEKLQEAQLEAAALKSRQEKEIRDSLEKEYLAKLEAGLKALKQNYVKTVDILGKLKEILYRKSEAELLDLVYSITRKVIGDEIKTSPQLVISMLEKGFKKIKEAKQYEIKVHPLDYQLLSQAKGNLQEILKGPGAIKFTQDESVERGGCKIITESGEISSEPGKQLDIIIKELADGT